MTKTTDKTARHTCHGETFCGKPRADAQRDCAVCQAEASAAANLDYRITFEPHQATMSGALDGYGFRCECGTAQTTSLGEQACRDLAGDHGDWHRARGENAYFDGEEGEPAAAEQPGADDDASEAFSPAAPAPPIRDRDLPNTTEVGELNALDTYRRDDWDSKGTVSLYIPEREARQMLMARGWTHQVTAGGWTSPAGRHYWELQEALQLALVAEVA